MIKKLMSLMLTAFLFMSATSCAAVGGGAADTTGSTDPATDSGSDTPNEHFPEPANPIITTLFTADPSAHVWGDGKVYIYASHDVFPSRGCDLMDKYHVFSSENMVDWADEGEILSSSELDWGCDGFMWAPDCAYRDGKYMFYYPHPEDGDNWNGSWRVGVAISDSPASGFTDCGMMMNADGKTPVGAADGTNNNYVSMIDLCVYTDTDGKSYLFIGGGGRLYVAELAEDMLSLAEPLRLMPSEQFPDYHEAPWVFRRGDTYYLMYADNTAGKNCMRYSTSDSLTGPYTPRGIFLTAVRDCDTTHGSIAEFGGEWYLFYHNSAISGNGTLRSVCIDRVYFNDDGIIATVTQTETSVEPAGERVFIPADKAVRVDTETDGGVYTKSTDYQAEKMLRSDDVTFNGTCLENLHISGAWFALDNVDGGAGGRALVTVCYSSADAAATALVESSAAEGEAYYLKMPGNGSWNDFSTYASVAVELAPGTDNRLTFTCGMSGVNVKSVCVWVRP